MTPQPTNADQTRSPNPELNPMLNPLLAQNMGRWAEVYFTHPPEEREQAVQELVRQLEQEKLELRDETPDPESFNAAGHFGRSGKSGGERGVICLGCGHENRPDQRYCGMCGVALLQPPAPTLERIPSTAAVTAAPGTLGEDAWADAEPAEERRAESPQHYFLEERRSPYDSDVEPPLFASTEPSFAYRYRVFLGLVLAVALGVLGYKAWQKEHSNPDVLQQALQIPPETTEQPAAPNEASNPPAANTPAPASAKTAAAQPAHAAAVPRAKTDHPTPAAEASTSKGASESSPVEAAKDSDTAPTDDATPGNKAAVTPAANTERIQANGGGAEELAMAQRYLNGETGRRDPSQAAQWLWKSVAKKNSEATLMLADLYLHGDGIQKNCDQARILLDAAARKGQTGAATRLRNLQAFGCQ